MWGGGTVRSVMSPADSLHVTIVTGPSADPLDLGRETELVKAVVLYANQVTLVSPKAAIFWTYGVEPRPETAQQPFGWIARLFLGLNADGSASREAMTDGQRRCVVEAEELMSKPSLGRKEKARLANLLEELRPVISRFVNGYRGALESAHAEELHLAISENVATFDLLGIWDARGQDRSLEEVMLEQYTQLAHACLSPDSRALPVFDACPADIRRAIHEAASVRKSDMKEVGLARELIARLPSYAGAPMESIFEARGLIADSLIRFRAAVSEAATSVDACPAEPGWEREVDRIWRRIVAPALLEVQEALGERKLAKVLRRAVTGGRVPAAAVGVTAYAACGSIELASAIGLACKLADSAVAELRERSRLQRDVRRNGFFLLHELESAVSRGGASHP